VQKLDVDVTVTAEHLIGVGRDSLLTQSELSDSIINENPLMKVVKKSLGTGIENRGEGDRGTPDCWQTY
jgi:hypothetical protein